MPVMDMNVQKHFKLDVIDDLPSSTITLRGTQRWLVCCPLCGCTHDVSGADDTQPYTPYCQSLPAVFRTVQVAWQKLHPEVAKYKTLRLVKPH